MEARRLPVETLQNIVNFAAPADLFSLSLTQYCLGAVAESRLYRNVTILTNAEKFHRGPEFWDLEDSMTCIRRSVLAQLALIKRPHRYHYVHSVTLEGCYHRTLPGKPTEIEDLVDPIRLVHMVNLREVECRDLCIRPSFRRTIFTLERLDALRFTRCIFRSPDSLATFDPIPRRRPTKVEFYSITTVPIGINEWASYLPQGLQKLHVRPSRCFRRILPTLDNQAITDKLTSLAFAWEESNDVFTRTLLAFLASAQAITSVSIVSQLDSTSVVEFPLPNTSLPHLQSFAGPERIAAAFVRGRPVQRALLYFFACPNQDLDTILYICDMSTANITELGLRCDSRSTRLSTEKAQSQWLEIISRIAEGAPSLQKLSLGTVPITARFKPTYPEELATRVLSRLSSLTELHFDLSDIFGVYLDAKTRNEHETLERSIRERSPCSRRDHIVNSCTRACPSLQRLVFGGERGWGGCEKLASDEWVTFTWDRAPDFWQVDNVKKWRSGSRRYPGELWEEW